MFGVKPYGQPQYRDVNGKRMAYVDERRAQAVHQRRAGAVVHGRIRELVRSWPNLTKPRSAECISSKRTAPSEIGAAVAEFVRINSTRKQ